MNVTIMNCYAEYLLNERMKYFWFKLKLGLSSRLAVHATLSKVSYIYLHHQFIFKLNIIVLIYTPMYNANLLFH
jgi:hypothetical protein